MFMKMKFVSLVTALAVVFVVSCSEDATLNGEPTGTPDTAETTSALLYADGVFLNVTAWGPKGSSQGIGFNVQRDGSSSFWIKVENKRAEATYVILVDDVPIKTRNPKASPLITGNVPAEAAQRIVAHPGTRTVSIVDVNQKRRQIVGEFLIE